MDYRGYSEVLFDALRADPFYRTLEQASPGRDAMLRYYDLSIAEGARWGRLCLPEKGSFGISVWSLPLGPEDARRKSAAKKQALVNAMGRECAACFARIEANMAVHEGALDLHDHYYLSILGVSPKEQGRGLGGSLLRPVLDEADAKGIPSYLTTFSPRNISFYERMGFHSAGAFPEPETGGDFHILIRDARQG